MGKWVGDRHRDHLVCVYYGLYGARAVTCSTREARETEQVELDKKLKSIGT